MTKQAQLGIFNEWIGHHKGLLFKIVRAYAINRADQDDLFQEIILRVWHSIPSFRQACAVSTWLYRVALNTAISWVRKEQKYVRAQPIEDVQHILLDNKIAVDERLEWLYREIHQLNEIDRLVILLLLEGFSYAEMAGLSGITESNIGVKINRIKKQLAIKSKKYHTDGI